MINRYYLKEIPVDCGLRTEVRRAVVDWLISSGKPRQVVTLNATMFISALKDSRLKRVIQGADLVTVDGYGIMSALQRRGFRTERFPGVELAEQLMDFCIREKLPVYCFGGTKGTMLGLRQKYGEGGSVFFRDGFSESEALVREEIIKLDPKLILAGLGCPRQEFFLAELLPELTATVGMGVGGALDVISGQKPRAPAIFSNHGWEWCCRMLQDPRKIKLLPELVKFWYRFLR
jgi:N-acetylglucosaminyldiphosphoundecaprenol N-acetyl-beta-D-mannosaminyltransferase